MAFAFLIPLFIGLITGHIFQRSTDETGYLAGGFAIVSFLISIVLAPWEIQLLLLVSVLLTAHKLLLINDRKIKFQDSHGKGLGSRE